MKKFNYLGRNKNGRYCLLKSAYSFDDLSNNIDNIESDDFIHVSGGWGGEYDYPNTINNILSKNPRELILKNPISFSGVDNDWGHEYGWDFNVIAIVEMED
ncbi:MAG: hypothetical protein J6U54_16030 [Clostridiales bacterium]|nr:hypothetical protein [Clostridiales bacterium]